MVPLPHVATAKWWCAISVQPVKNPGNDYTHN